MKKSKALMFSLVIVFVSLVIGLIVAFIKEECNDEIRFDTSTITLNININSNLEIKDNMLYDKSTQKEVTISEKYNTDYKMIALYDFDKYLFLVFSNNQEELVNDMYLLDHINVEGHNRLFLVSKETGRGILININGQMDTSRLNLSSIKFIDNDLFVIEEYNYNNYLIRKLFYFQIINKEKLFDVLNTSFNFINVNDFILKSYLVTKNSIIIEYNNNGNLDYQIYSSDPNFSYQTEEINGKTLVTSSSFGLRLKNTTNKYYDKEYLFLGLFSLVDGKIIYLDNDLSVRCLLDDNIINTVESVDEFKELYQ